MRGDKVVLKVGILNTFRKTRALSHVQLYKKLGVHFVTGAKVFRGEPISLATAKRIAKAVRIKVQDLIERWADDEQVGTEGHPRGTVNDIAKA